MLPTEMINITSYVEEALPQLFQGRPNLIKLVKAERTFWEKATILHKEAHRINNRTPIRYSRHYYDLYQMSKSEIKQRAFERYELLAQVVAFKQKVSILIQLIMIWLRLKRLDYFQIQIN